jgi:hypothetical protein
MKKKIYNNEKYIQTTYHYYSVCACMCFLPQCGEKMDSCNNPRGVMYIISIISLLSLDIKYLYICHNNLKNKIFE